MSLSTMYTAKAGSPKTTLASALAAADTSMTLTDASVLPAAPNLAVIGSDASAEVVSYSAVTGNVVSGLVRGLGGTTASAWTAGAEVARNITSLDHDTFRANILDLDTRVPVNSTADRFLHHDGTNYEWEQVDLASDDVKNALPVSKGGTGASTEAGARTNLGLGSMAVLDDPMDSILTDGFFGRFRNGSSSGWGNFATSVSHSQVFYVDASTGSDSNDGLTSSTAFATIDKAIQSMYAGGDINIAGGTQNSPLAYAGFSCTGKLIKLNVGGHISFTSAISIYSSVFSIAGYSISISFSSNAGILAGQGSHFVINTSSNSPITLNFVDGTGMIFQSSIGQLRACNITGTNTENIVSIQNSILVAQGGNLTVNNSSILANITSGLFINGCSMNGFSASPYNGNTYIVKQGTSSSLILA